LEAAKEIARQLRLRDMGGIIVVDFIDMKTEENKKLLYNKLKEFMKDDRAKHAVIPPSKFGLIEITRQRVRPEMDIKTSETCPSCGGKGEVQSTVLLIDEIENNLRYITQQLNIRNLKILLHPFVEAYITKGFFNSIKKKWQKEYNCKLELRSSNALTFLEYHFINKENEEEIIL
jgi:ribonuclease G